MYPKTKHKESQRASKPRKKHFKGNQCSKKDETDNGNKQSATVKKLNTSNSDEVIYNLQHTYRIIEFFTVFPTLAQILICK